MASFNHYYPSIADLDINFSDVLSILHESDSSSENPIVNEALQVFNQLEDIAEIQGGYAILDKVEIIHKEGEIKIGNYILKPHSQICGYLKNAEKLAIFICTAGENFSILSDRYNKEGEYLKGYFTDMLGSIVAEKSMDYIQQELEKQVQLEFGMKITNRYSPGYCNWEVNDQKQLFALLPHNNCKITLSKSCLMLPIKSVSGIIGIGKRVRKNIYACDICNNTTCIYRKVKDKNLQH